METQPRQIINLIDQMILPPEKFVERHPELSRDQIAKIVGCKRRTVNGWFAPSDRLAPNKGHMALLWLYDRAMQAPDMLRLGA
jgi:hypothetical protein